MEVADQWQREWAGTAEYGKVTEGGITRRIARAMEVLHASGPGARVRVMRAAYHSTAGPGVPAESFMLHSSRRVISSGFNFLEPPSLHATKPLEISSTPLHLTRDFNGDTEKYKVTEPDDIEISEPSKWKATTGGRSLRMPSEESSSTDNASIIDLDPKTSKNLHRKNSYDSESSDIQLRSKSNSISFQHLDAPTILSTLKYKSLLNKNSNEWNNRRKSYGFEDTSPLDETVKYKNRTLAMESSTDSGICKSTEIMDNHVDNNSYTKYSSEDDQPYHKEESFRDWLSKNRQNTQYMGTRFKTYRDHKVVLEEENENNIVLQSPGKVSITLPVTIETNNSDTTRKAQNTEDADRKLKKVEFCKTEIHFTAESGKVNIIATDDKPPPSNDFRKRRSAFVPMQDIIDRPITLLRERNAIPMSDGNGPSRNFNNDDFGELDENTAATKSILKNKIPKPKPYLLGENMEFGPCGDVSRKNDDSLRTTISFINQQLEPDKCYKGEIQSTFSNGENSNNNVCRTIDTGPFKNNNFKYDKPLVTDIKIEKSKKESSEEIKNKVSSLRISPTPIKHKTRQLRESDLTYFGIDSNRRHVHKEVLPRISLEKTPTNVNLVENIFHSVKLIQQVSRSVSNSVCNSEAESEETPEYQNLPMDIDNYAPIPAPRFRSKFETNEINQVRAALKPIAEKESDETKDNKKSYSRRTRIRRQDEIKASRSLSEPPKNLKLTSMQKTHRREDLLLSKIQEPDEENPRKESKKLNYVSDKQDDIPIYVNLKDGEGKISDITLTYEKRSRESAHRKRNTKKNEGKQIAQSGGSKSPDCNYNHNIKDHHLDSENDTSGRKKISVDKDTLSSALKREVKVRSVEKTSKPSARTKNINGEQSNSEFPKPNEDPYKYKREEINKKEHISRKLQRPLPKSVSEETQNGNDNCSNNPEASNQRKRNSSREINSVRENIKPSSKLSRDSSPRRLGPTKHKDKEPYSKSSNHKTSKHREYVINYDDKKGTVSSICKITPVLGVPRQKKTSKVVLKENNKDNALRIKTIDKSLLQLEDHQREPKVIYAGRKWKTKIQEQKSCQLL